MIGFYRLHALFGLYYSIYFIFRRNKIELLSDKFLNRILLVAALGSVISLLFLAFPSLLDFTGGSVKAEDLISDVGSSFVRLRSNFYIFCQLAIVIVLFRMSHLKRFSFRTACLSVLLVLNFVAVFVSGYRANMIMSALLLALYAFRAVCRGTKAHSFVVSALVVLPILFVVYAYTVQRDQDTISDQGEESSLVYRVLEADMGLTKLDETGGWLFGVGYADGFLNPLATEGQQETVLLHNGYVSILYNYGIVGVIAWSALIFAVLRMVATNVRALWANTLGFLLAVFLIQQLILNFFQGVFNRGTEPLVCFILALALLERLLETDVMDQRKPLIEPAPLANPT